MTRQETYAVLAAAALWVPAVPACSSNGGGGNPDAGTVDEDDESPAQWATIPGTGYPNDGNVYVCADGSSPVTCRSSPQPADFTCLGTPDSSQASTFDQVTFTGVLKDFQSKEPVDGAEIAVWTDLATIGQAATRKAAVTSGGDGTFSVTVSGLAGLRRLHWRSSKEGTAFPTWELNDPFKPDQATQSTERSSVSIVTGNLLPALAAVSRTEGKGIIAGAVRDCNRKEVGNAIATVLGADGKPLPYMQVVYMSDSDLPRRRDPKTLHSLATNPQNGIFVVVNVPPSTSLVTLAVDGKVGGVRKRLSQFDAPVFADTVVVVDADPLRAQ